MNPEDDVLADIDSLVEESLSRGPRDDYNRQALARIDDGKINLERCDVCGRSWHGLPIEDDCPSMFAADGEIEEYRQSRNPKPHKVINPCEDDSPWCELMRPQPGALWALPEMTVEWADPVSRALEALGSMMEQMVQLLTGLNMADLNESIEEILASMSSDLRESFEDPELSVHAQLWVPGIDEHEAQAGYTFNTEAATCQILSEELEVPVSQRLPMRREDV